MKSNIEDLKKCYSFKDAKIILAVLIQANSKKNEIQGFHDNKLKLRIHSPPVDGKANKEIIKFLSQIFAIKKNQLEIIKGHTEKVKLLQISDLSIQLFEQRIQKAFEEFG